MQADNLWEQVANRALKHAAALLDSETAPTAATVETVRELVETAILVNGMSNETPIAPDANVHLRDLTAS